MLLVAALAATALAITGCGSDEEGEQLPPAAADQLERQLGFIERAIDQGSLGACRSVLEGAQPNRAEVERILEGLPEDVDPELREATEDSFSRLFDLVEEDCEEKEADAETETETTPTATETVPTETETTPTETETTETTPPQDDGPPGGGRDNGDNGNGDNNGDGGAPSQGGGGGLIAPQGGD